MQEPAGNKRDEVDQWYNEDGGVGDEEGAIDVEAAVEARYQEDADDSSAENGSDADNFDEEGDGEGGGGGGARFGGGAPLTVVDAFYGGGGAAMSSSPNTFRDTSGEVGDTSALSDEEFAHRCDKWLLRGRGDIQKVEALIARFDSTKDELQLPTTDAVLLEKYILDPVTVGLLEYKDYYTVRLEKALQLVRAMRADVEHGGVAAPTAHRIAVAAAIAASSSGAAGGSGFNAAASRRKSVTGTGRLVTTETGDGTAYVTVLADNGQHLTFVRAVDGEGESGIPEGIPGSPEGGKSSAARSGGPVSNSKAGAAPPATYVPIADLSEDLDIMMGPTFCNDSSAMRPLTRMRCVLQLVRTLNILLAHKEATLHVLETISIREAALSDVVLLAESTERGDAADEVEAAVILHRLMYNLQCATLNTVDAIRKWREGLCVPRPFVCGSGHNYIHKIVSDCKALGDHPAVNRALPMQQLFCRYPLMSNLPSISLYALQKEAERPFKVPPPPPLATQYLTIARASGGTTRASPSATTASSTAEEGSGGTSSRSGGDASPKRHQTDSSRYKLYKPLGAPPCDPAYQSRVEAAEAYVHTETARLLGGIHTLLKLCSAGEFLPVVNIAPVCPALRKQVSLYNQAVAARLRERATATKPNATGGGGGSKPKFGFQSLADLDGKKKLPRVTTRLPQAPPEAKGLVPPFTFTSGIKIGDRELQEDYEAILLEYIHILQNPPFRGEYDEWKTQEDQRADNTRKYRSIHGKGGANKKPSLSATALNQPSLDNVTPTASPLTPSPQSNALSGTGSRAMTPRTQAEGGQKVDKTLPYRRSSVSLTGPLLAMPPTRYSVADAPKPPPQ